LSDDVHGAAAGSTLGMVPGSRIAGYRLEERLGQGGMAVVFKARDERLGRPVALKILAPALAGNREFQRRFISESRAAAAIDDPHIVPVYAAGEADGMLFIAMRHISGGDAQSVLRREGTLPPDRVAAIISPVASALDAAHRVGLVHRDVKPSNMLMDVLPGRPAHVYLSDFGLSKMVASTSGLTASGTILGTLAYMSPEQIKGLPVDGRADQYALACSAFELLSGAPPFQRDEPAALMYAHLSVAPPPLTSRRPDLRPRSTPSCRRPWPRQRMTATPVAGSSPTRCATRSASRPTARACESGPWKCLRCRRSPGPRARTRPGRAGRRPSPLPAPPARPRSPPRTSSRAASPVPAETAAGRGRAGADGGLS